jgi:hypothetical protein
MCAQSIDTRTGKLLDREDRDVAGAKMRVSMMSVNGNLDRPLLIEVLPSQIVVGKSLDSLFCEFLALFSSESLGFATVRKDGIKGAD